MKKLFTYSFLIISFLLLTLTTSCSKQEVETEVYTYDNVFYLSADTSLGSLSFHAETELLSQFQNHEVLNNVNRQIVAKIFGEVFNSYPTDSLLPKYANALYQEYKKSNEPYLEEISQLQGAKSILENEIAIQGVAMYLDEKLLSYSYERYGFMGGAHGNSSRLLYNFDLSNAKLLSESDIFTENYKDALTQLIKQQIVEDNAEIESVADLSDFHFYEDKIKPNNNFYITADGLVYVFNPYEIAPYSTGQTIVLITFEKLKPILKPDNPIAYIYETPAN